MAKKRNAIKLELEQIRHSHKGLLTAHNVVKFARRKTTALHSQFEWDDSVAGHQWRLNQARQLIRLHVETYEDDGPPIRAYVNLTTDRYDRAQGGGYRATSDVMSNKEWRDQLLLDAHDDMERFRDKYATLKELAGVREAMKKVRKPRKKKAS